MGRTFFQTIYFKIDMSELSSFVRFHIYEQKQHRERHNETRLEKFVWKNRVRVRSKRKKDGKLNCIDRCLIFYRRPKREHQEECIGTRSWNRKFLIGRVVGMAPVHIAPVHIAPFKKSTTQADLDLSLHNRREHLGPGCFLWVYGYIYIY